jgi:para-nitrobenzyl esterase
MDPPVHCREHKSIKSGDHKRDEHPKDLDPRAPRDTPMTRLHSLFHRLLLLAALTLIGACSSDRPLVSTPDGQVLGVVRNGVEEFRGIPYAQPLQPQDRWSQAIAAAPRATLLDATNFGPACPQTARFDLTEASLVEACLSLNVSRPLARPQGQSLPVLVWIPGGGFVGGGSNLYRLDKLAREGQIIVVSVNYRVGALGFMSHPALAADPANGNFGLEDQRLALRWVQNNIAAFGGDPARVTLAGESAGSASVCLQLLSASKTSGLYHQAITASYGCLYPWPTVAQSIRAYAPGLPDLLKPTWQLMAEQTGCFNASDPGSLAELNCMRNKPLDQLLDAQVQVTALQPVFPFAPKIDSGASGTLPLRDYSLAQIDTHFNRVPILNGGTTDELRLYVAYDALNPHFPFPFPKDRSQLNSEFMKNYFQIYYGLDFSVKWSDHYQTIIDRFFPSGVGSAAQVGSVFSHYIPVAGLSNCASLQAAQTFTALGAPIYQWQFADPDAPVLGVGIAAGQDPRMELGAVHSSELNYLFPNLSNNSAINAPDLPSRSQVLADQFTQVWASFVKTGSPKTPDTPSWLPYHPTQPARVMRFSPGQIQTFDARAYHHCEFWESLDPKLTTR